MNALLIALLGFVVIKVAADEASVAEALGTAIGAGLWIIAPLVALKAFDLNAAGRLVSIAFWVNLLQGIVFGVIALFLSQRSPGSFSVVAAVAMLPVAAPFFLNAKELWRLKVRTAEAIPETTK